MSALLNQRERLAKSRQRDCSILNFNDPAFHFDGRPNFLAQVKNRSRLFGWSTILNVADDQGTAHDLLTSYGMVSLANVQAHATANYVGQQSRDAQNSEMMHHFIFDSLTPEFRTKVNLHCQDYTVGTALDGACLLKRVIMLTFIDTRATTAYIRELLVDMPNQIVKLEYNITTFNEWVDTQVTTLRSRGEQVNNLLTYLWKTYLNVPDTKFLRYIEGHCDQYLDGSAYYTPKEIMHLAENYYKTRFQIDDWRKLSGKQEEIVALNMKITQLENYAIIPESGDHTQHQESERQADNQTKSQSDTIPSTLELLGCQSDET